MTNSLSRAALPPDRPAAEVGEKLDWNAFSARYFPGRRTHDLDAVAAYGAYKQGRDWRNSGREAPPSRLTPLPNDSVPTPIEAESDGPALERLLVAAAAEQI